MQEQHTYFIGYDAREDEAAKVAAHSIAVRARHPRARIYILEHMQLRKLGLFRRAWHTHPDGQMQDVSDGRPFSTAFSHSRFLVFHLASELKCTGPCMFVDCDWLFLDDPSKLMEQQRQQSDKIGVVMRDRKVEENSIKMDGMLQQNYSRKLWSALFTFTPQSKWTETFTPDAVNELPGRELHGFCGLPDAAFWDIDPAWHYIPSLDERPTPIKGLHFSEMSPWLNPDMYETSPDEFDFWLREREAWLHSAIRPERMGLLPWRNLEVDLKLAGA